MTTPWGWTPERTLGIWRHGAAWTRPASAAVPFLTVLLLLLMLHFVGGTLTSARGVLFDLPESGLGEGEATGLVALVMPMPHETLVFFDDSRYLLGDEASLRSLGENIALRADKSSSRTLLVLADRRVAGGELFRLAAVARRSGISRMLFAEKKAEPQE
ncbi:MAG: hypothetical protein J6T51_04555 [Kiritimatiellae bacterium]|nr:hypothetical protein [Kiritimatiellia bacterium]